MTQPPDVLLRLDQVTHKFGPVTALWNITLDVHEGEFVAIFGPNGAGKTTLLRAVSQLTRPTRGTVKFLRSGQGRGHVGYVSHQSLLYNDMTGLENLVFYARLYDVPDTESRARQTLQKMGLAEARHHLVRGYSRGMKQRLTLGRALLHDPLLVLLDEPYTGLDQHGSRLLTQVLDGLREAGRTVMLITHNLAEGLQLCTRVLIQNHGEIVFEGDGRTMERRELEELYFSLIEGSTVGA